MRMSIADRFWPKVLISSGEDDCWPWTRGRRNVPGEDYGNFRWVNPVTGKNEVTGAHRVAFWLENGYLPEMACHTCDNLPCCRPKHIYDGDAVTNGRDKAVRGRARGKQQDGETNTQARLTSGLVIQMRKLARAGLTLPQIRERLAVPTSDQVTRWAINGRTWKHLDSIEAPFLHDRGQHRS